MIGALYPGYELRKFADAIPKEHNVMIETTGKTLVGLLQDKDPRMWAAAARALGGLKYEPAIIPLIHMLDFADELMEANIVHIHGDEEKWKEYVRRFEINNPADIRDALAAGIYALGEIDTEAAVIEVKNILYEKTQRKHNFCDVALRAYGMARGPQAIDEIIPFLQKDERYVYAAIDTLGMLGQHATSNMIQALVEMVNQEKYHDVDNLAWNVRRLLDDAFKRLERTVTDDTLRKPIQDAQEKLRHVQETAKRVADDYRRAQVEEMERAQRERPEPKDWPWN